MVMQIVNQNLQTQIIEDSGYIYVCESIVGTPSSKRLWSIHRIDSTGSKMYAISKNTGLPTINYEFIPSEATDLFYDYERYAVQPEFTFTINDGDLNTTETEVTLEIDIDSYLNINGYSVSENEDDTFFSETMPETFELSESDGEKTLYLKVRDVLGRIQTETATITYDSTPPISYIYYVHNHKVYRTSDSSYPDIPEPELMFSITGDNVENIRINNGNLYFNILSGGPSIYKIPLPETPLTLNYDALGDYIIPNSYISIGEGFDISPDGTTLIVVNEDDSILSYIDVATGDVTPATSDDGSFPTYSPDGNYIVYKNNSESGMLYKKDSNDNSNGIAITSSIASYPTYSPDGQHIVYTNVGDSGKLYKKDSNDTSDGSAINSVDSINPTYSPDGNYIAYTYVYHPSLGNNRLFRKDSNDTLNGINILYFFGPPQGVYYPIYYITD